jgi:hypothetical protein
MLFRPAKGVECFAMAQTKNIEAAGPECLTWNCADHAASLQELLKYVESEAQKAINWYWKNKRPKSFCSRATQFSAVVLTSLAAILPIVGVMTGIDRLQNPLWASLLVGLAAALLALDKAFGFSSGWARYVMAATNIRKALEEFRMDWAVLAAKACPSPTAEQVEALIRRAKEFRVTVEGIVIQETKDWVNEFQANLAQLEKDVTAQLAALRAQAEKAAQVREAAAQPGSIGLTVPNADQADGSKISIRLESASAVVAQEVLTGSKTWARLDLPPAAYRVTVSATAGGRPIAAVAAVIVKPGEVAVAQIPLPL